jgi:CheY-like chemotaxis protein
MNVEFETVFDCYQGEEAIKRAISSGFIYDAIFVKLYMPIRDGFELTREIRKLETKYEFTD